MISKRGLSPRIRLTGLLASLVAVCALAVTVVADNGNVGFGHTVTRGEQASLLVLAALLLVAQTVGYLIHRAGDHGPGAMKGPRPPSTAQRNDNRGNL